MFIVVVVTLMLASAWDLCALSGLGEDRSFLPAVVKDTMLLSVSVAEEAGLGPAPGGLCAAFSASSPAGTAVPLRSLHGGSEELWLPSGEGLAVG